MESNLHVASPPPKPLMIYDGDCNFCTLWIQRWQRATGDRIEYLPCQDPQVAARFPEIPAAQFESAVRLIQPDGKVYGAAEAVLRALALSPHGDWLLDLYLHWPAFAAVAEASYRFVARHRTFFSWLTRWLWGRHVEPPDYHLLRWSFLRGLGVIYLIAFLSLWGQIGGLIGREGITPAQLTMQTAELQATVAGIGANRYHLLPTLCWFNASDASLQWQCAAGTTLALLLIADFAPAPCLFLLWLLYLSLTTVGGVFLEFQWDNLLLETGFLAVFFAPLRWFPRRPSREPPPSRLMVWLLRWLLFRLVFESGCVKLLSGDPAWRHLSALQYHYETQPLPTWIGWYAWQLPLWIQKSEAVVMFIIELAVPFLIFTPRRPRQLACLAFAVFQVLIMLTGNYGFFNLLTLVLCLALLDDAALHACLRPLRRFASACRQRLRFPPRPAPAQSTIPPPPGISSPPPPPATRRIHWPGFFAIPLAVIVFFTSVVQFVGMLRAPLPSSHPVVALYRWLRPLRSFNAYGLFAVMTTNRFEIIVQGSNNGVDWKPYEFKYKPGNPLTRPGFVEPLQPRLDWQMWFAALGNYRRNPWFVSFCVRLLQGSPQVLALLEKNPFPHAPPRYVRALVYQYHFTDWSTRRKSGAWWTRELEGVYLPPISLRPTASRINTSPGSIPVAVPQEDTRSCSAHRAAR